MDKTGNKRARVNWKETEGGENEQNGMRDEGGENEQDGMRTGGYVGEGSFYTPYLVHLVAVT